MLTMIMMMIISRWQLILRLCPVVAAVEWPLELITIIARKVFLLSLKIVYRGRQIKIRSAVTFLTPEVFYLLPFLRSIGLLLTPPSSVLEKIAVLYPPCSKSLESFSHLVCANFLLGARIFFNPLYVKLESPFPFASSDNKALPPKPFFFLLFDGFLPSYENPISPRRILLNPRGGLLFNFISPRAHRKMCNNIYTRNIEPLLERENHLRDTVLE